MTFYKQPEGPDTGWYAFGMVRWDYKAQPDWGQMNRVLQRLGNDQHPVITQVEDTGSDEEAVIIASRPLTQDECQVCFAYFLRLENDV